MGENKNLGSKAWLELKKRGLLVFLFLVLVGVIVLAAVYGNGNVKAEKVDTTKDLYVSTEEGLNLRQNPSFYAKSIEVLPYLAKLNLVNNSGDWVEVEYGSQKGWVYTKYLTNEKPAEFSVRDLKFEELVNLRANYSDLLEPEFADFNQDGREDVLLTVAREGVSKHRDYYIYGYENGYILKKLLVINPSQKPELFGGGYRGFSTLEWDGSELKFSYPSYGENDGLCCPSQGTVVKKFYWNGQIFDLR